MTDKLEPCPFCGAIPTIRIFKGKDGWRDRYAVICRYDEGGCGAESGLFHYEEEAVDAWNQRTKPEKKKGKWIPVTQIVEWSEADGFVGFPPEEAKIPIGITKYIDATEPDKVDAVRCSECGTVFDFQESHNWCAECGAYMRDDLYGSD